MAAVLPPSLRMQFSMHCMMSAAAEAVAGPEMAVDAGSKMVKAKASIDRVKIGRIMDSFSCHQ